MSSLQVKVKKLNENAVIPKYSTSGSAGLDLVAIEEKLGLDYVEYKTGLAFSIPSGFVGVITPRSSISSNTSMILNNSVGIIDSDYTGEITFRFKMLKEYGTRRYKIGDRIGQLVIIPLPKVELQEVEDLPKTERGDGSYGSTGN